MSDPPEEFAAARDYFNRGQFRAAREKLEDLVETYPNSANVNYMLGVIHFESGELEEALPYFEKGADLEHDPQLQVWSRQYVDRIQYKINNENEEP